MCNYYVVALNTHHLTNRLMHLSSHLCDLSLKLRLQQAILLRLYYTTTTTTTTTNDDDNIT